MKQLAFISGFCASIMISLVLGVSLVYSETSTTPVTINAIVAGCGDGVINGSEVCDGVALGGNSCSDVGDFTGGTLSCSASCTFDTTDCTTGGGGGPDPVCTGDCTEPSIASISSNIGITTSTVTWTATDNVAVTTCSFGYSTDTSYGTIGSVVRDGDSFHVDVMGLSPETSYNFQISCSDAKPNTATQIGNFTTLAPSGPDGDTNGPTITIDDITPSITTCTVDWSAADVSGVDSCSIRYGVGIVDTNGVVIGSYASTLSGLIPATTYTLQVTCVDMLGNTASVTDSCTTEADVVPPPPISNLVVTPGDTVNNLSWTYTETLSDFSAYIIRTDTTACPLTADDGTLLGTIGNISSTNQAHLGLTNGTTYYYSVFVSDTSGNISSGVCANGIPIGPAVDDEICTDGIDNDGDGDIDCADTDCSAHSSCIDEPPPDSEICTDGIDNDGDGDIDCADTDCSEAPSCEGGTDDDEICTDGIDNDRDGFIDCADVDCAADPSCTEEPPPDEEDPDGGGEDTELICNDAIDNDSDGDTDCDDIDCREQPACIARAVACDDGIDNDGDGLVDLLDPGCTSSDDLDEYNPPEDVIVSTETVQQHDITVFIAERTITIPTAFISGVSTLVGDQLSVRLLPPAERELNIASAILYFGKEQISFTRVPGSRGWFVDAVVPAVGVYEPTIEVRYESGETSVHTFTLRSLPYGVVQGAGDPLGGVLVTLTTASGIVDTGVYRQANPYTTSENGSYGYVLPNGTYTVRFEREGFERRTIRNIVITNNVFNQSITLISLPETPQEIVTYVAEKTREIVNDGVYKIREAANDPVVQKTARQVTPVAVAVSTAAFAPSLITILFPLLRFLFLQPLLIFARRKRKQYGIVYNSLSKRSIDLVTVRLVDAVTNKIVQSRVTNRQGQYVFIPQAGSYRIDITKPGYTFPSAILKGQTHDGRLADVYHGEIIVVQEDGVLITPNIPLDPIEVHKKPTRLYLQKVWVFTQHALAISGLVITLVTALIAPVWYVWTLLGVHIVLYVIFLLYIRPRKPKGWGIVYNTQNKKPIGRVVARLFSKQYDKLVATELTDNKGQYAFLAGPNEYYVVFEKSGFETERQDVQVEEEDIISDNVPLKPTDRP